MISILVKFLLRYWLHILAIGAAIAALAYIVGMIDQGGYDRADRKWQSKWDAEQLKIVELNAEHERKLRDQEQQWQAEFNRISKDAQIQQNQIANNLVAANRERDSLQQQYKKALQSRQCGSPTATGSSTATGVADDLPAYVFARTDEAAGELAEYADRLTVAISACNAAYDKITKAKL